MSRERAAEATPRNQSSRDKIHARSGASESDRGRKNTDMEFVFS